MTNQEESRTGKLSSAAAQAQQALNSAKEFVASADLDQLRTQAAETASALLKQGREALASEPVANATEELAASIRRNPLAAIGIAFTAGLVLALITRS